MVKGTVTAVISAVKGVKMGDGSVPADYADFRCVLQFRPKFNSPDGSGNPFLAAVDCLSQGFPKRIAADSRTEPDLHVTVTALQIIKMKGSD